jgi:hypothetical protein
MEEREMRGNPDYDASWWEAEEAYEFERMLAAEEAALARQDAEDAAKADKPESGCGCSDWHCPCCGDKSDASR